MVCSVCKSERSLGGSLFLVVVGGAGGEEAVDFVIVDCVDFNSYKEVKTVQIEIVGSLGRAIGR